MTKQEKLELLARLERIIDEAERRAREVDPDQDYYYYAAKAGCLNGAIKRLIWDLREGAIYFSPGKTEKINVQEG